METSEKVKKFRRSVPGLFTGALICTALILFAIYPYKPNSIFAWAALLVGSLPIVLLLEYSGEILFENKIMQRANRVTRILLGVFCVLLICVIVLFAWGWVKPLFDTWQ